MVKKYYFSMARHTNLHFITVRLQLNLCCLKFPFVRSYVCFIPPFHLCFRTNEFEMKRSRFCFEHRIFCCQQVEGK